MLAKRLIVSRPLLAAGKYGTFHHTSLRTFLAPRSLAFRKVPMVPIMAPSFTTTRSFSWTIPTVILSGVVPGVIGAVIGAKLDDRLDNDDIPFFGCCFAIAGIALGTSWAYGRSEEYAVACAEKCLVTCREMEKKNQLNKNPDDASLLWIHLAHPTSARPVSYVFTKLGRLRDQLCQSKVLCSKFVTVDTTDNKVHKISSEIDDYLTRVDAYLILIRKNYKIL